MTFNLPHNHKTRHRAVRSRASLAIACIAGLAILAGPSYSDASAHPVAVGGTPAPKAGALTLADCLRLAAKNSPSIDTSALAIDEATQRLIQAKATFKPTYQVSAHAAVSTSPDVTFSGSNDTLVNRERERVKLSVHYTVADGGKRKFTVEAAKANVESARARQAVNEVALLQETSLAYYNALHAHNAIDIGNVAVETAQRNLDQTKTRFSIGTVTRSDILTATSALDSAKSDLEMHKLAVQDADAQLAVLIGANPTQPLELAGAQPPDWTLVDDLDTLLSKAQTASPLSQQILASKSAAQSTLKAIKAERKPVITLVGEGGEIAIEDTGSGQYAFKPYVVVGADVTMPLWNGTLQHAREQEQTDIIKAQDAALQQMAIDLKRQLALGVATYHTSVNRVAIASDTVDNAQQAYEFAQAKYSAGKTTEEDVVQALGLVSVARDQYQQTVNERDTAAQNLRWLTGLDMPAQYIDATDKP